MIQDIYGDDIQEDVLDIFSIFDEDGSGKIEKKEMISFIQDLVNLDVIEESIPTNRSVKVFTDH
jgi:Ca2+-binding EF-hand superfamily protein